MSENNISIPNVNCIDDIDLRFELINEGEIIVSKNYKHNKQLSKLNPKDFYYFNEGITDKNFKNVSYKFERGKKYTVKMFQIKKMVKSEDCLFFLRSKEALLVGTQGESLLWQQNKEIFPVSKWTISFDEKKALFKNKDVDLDWRIPQIFRHSSNGWKFSLGNFGDDWNDDFCLICFSASY